MSDFKMYESKAKLQFELNTDGSLSLTSKSLQLFEIGLMFTDLLEIARIKRVLENIQLNILIKSLNTNKLYDIKLDNDLYSETEIINRANYLLDNFENLNMQRPIDVVINNTMIKNGLGIEDISKRFSISRIGSSKYINVSIEDKDPFAAKFIIDILTKAWIKEYRYEIKQRYKDKSESIANSCDRARVELSDLYDSLKVFKRKHNIIDIDATKKFIIDRSSELQKEISKGKKELASDKSSIDFLGNTLENKKDFGFKSESDDIHLSIMHLKDSLRKLQQEREYNAYNLEKLPSDYTTKLDAKIRSIENKIKNNLSKSISSTTYDPSLTKQSIVNKYIQDQINYVKLEAQVSTLEDELNQLTYRSRQNIDVISNIVKLEGQIETKEKYYLNLLEKKHFAELLEKESGNNFFIIETANFPIKPKSSKRGLIIVGASMGSMILILVIVVLRIIFDAKHHLPFQIDKESKIPIIASIYLLPVHDYKHKFKPRIISKLQRWRQNYKRKLVAGGNTDSRKYLRRLILDLDKDGKNIITFMGARSNHITLHTLLELQKMFNKTNIKSLIIYNDWFSPLDVNQKEYKRFEFKDRETINDSGVLDLSQEECSPYDLLLPDDWFSLLVKLRQKYQYILLITPPTHQSTIWHEWLNLTSDVFYVYELHETFDDDDVKHQEYLLETHCNVFGGFLTSNVK
ncbi:GumC family protein [Flammeovirga pacifica]|nr:hypothetical protein [Flammeovirga pacifica]